MRSSCATLLALLLLATTPPPASAEGPTRGIATTFNLGGNFIIPMSDDDFYDDLDPSVGLDLGFMYRFGRTVGLRLNYMFGNYDTPSAGSRAEVYAYFMALDIGPRFFIPAGPVDITIDLGLGWDMLTFGTKGSGVTIDTTNHGLDLVLGLGAEYRVIDGLSVGLGLQYHLPYYLHTCFTSADEGEQCGKPDVKWKKIPHDLMLGASVTVYWSKLLDSPGSNVEIAEGGRSSLPSSGSSGGRRNATVPAKQVRSKRSTAAPTGKTQRRMLPDPFVSRKGHPAMVRLGASQDELIGLFGMPPKMDKEGDNTRFIYGKGTRRMNGFRQMVLLISPEDELKQVDLTPLLGIAAETIKKTLGKPTASKRTGDETTVWVYRKYRLAFFFKASSDQAYHVRMKVF